MVNRTNEVNPEDAGTMQFGNLGSSPDITTFKGKRAEFTLATSNIIVTLISWENRVFWDLGCPASRITIEPSTSKLRLWGVIACATPLGLRLFLSGNEIIMFIFLSSKYTNCCFFNLK
jgi:hypothetical protein